MNYEDVIRAQSEVKQERKDKIKRDLINKIIYDLNHTDIEEMNEWANWIVSRNKRKIYIKYREE